MESPPAGSISWVDITVEDATGLRDFYAAVAGWRPSPVEMGDYSDFSMLAGDGNAVSGICHARGENTGLPAQWLIYITVDDLDSSLAECASRGGEVLSGPRSIGSAKMAVIRDPAGAAAALYQAGDSDG